MAPRLLPSNLGRAGRGDAVCLTIHSPAEREGLARRLGVLSPRPRLRPSRLAAAGVGVSAPKPRASSRPNPGPPPQPRRPLLKGRCRRGGKDFCNQIVTVRWESGCLGTVGPHGQWSSELTVVRRRPLPESGDWDPHPILPGRPGWVPGAVPASPGAFLSAHLGVSQQSGLSAFPEAVPLKIN